MNGKRWMTLEEAARFMGISFEHLWDYIMGRVSKGRRLTVYRLRGGDQLRIREKDLLALLEAVDDYEELAELEKRPPRKRPPGHLF